MNYFDVFALPRMLELDRKQLEEKFHQLSRRFHPDFFAQAAEADKRHALRMTALINDAYRTLRDPMRRIDYLLTLEGVSSEARKLPPQRLADMFDLSEEAAHLKALARNGDVPDETGQRLREAVEARRADFTARLQLAIQQWDALVAEDGRSESKKERLADLASAFSEGAYLDNLERDLDALGNRNANPCPK